MAQRHPFAFFGGIPFCGSQSEWGDGGSALAHCLEGTFCIPCVYAVGTTAACRGTKTKQKFYPDNTDECAMCAGMTVLSLFIGPLPFMGCYTRVVGAEQNPFSACIQELFPIVFCTPCAMATYIESPASKIDDWKAPPNAKSPGMYATML
jgi:hypothetical protein